MRKSPLPSFATYYAYAKYPLSLLEIERLPCDANFERYFSPARRSMRHYPTSGVHRKRSKGLYAERPSTTELSSLQKTEVLDLCQSQSTERSLLHQIAGRPFATCAVERDVGCSSSTAFASISFLGYPNRLRNGISRCS